MNFKSTFGRPLGLAAAATFALGLATTASGFVTPANAATGPTAALRHGTVTVTGTAARDVIAVTIDADQVGVDFGGDGTVDAQFKRSRVQALSVLGGEGDDGLSVLGSGVGDLPITVTGGGGNDGGVVAYFGEPLFAGNAPITLFGNDGNDGFFAAVPGPVTIDTGAGDDLLEVDQSSQAAISLGDGNDRFKFSLATFSGERLHDIVDGGTGQDTLEVDGTFASEVVDLSANAGHLIVDFNEVDADNIENVRWVGLGGNGEGFGDQVTVNDLSGTDVVNFTPDFTDPLDGIGPNSSADQVRIVGTAGVDRITVSGSGSNITVAGLAPTVTPINLDSLDTLRIDTLDGNDIVNSSGLQRGLVELQVF
jgi:hypothetical protein